MSELMIYNQTFASDLHVSADIQKEIQELWLARGMSDMDLPDMQLALEEGLANAIKHGNKMDPNKQVTVECFMNEDVVRVVIKDEGNGFDLNEVPDPTLPENLDKPSGRGVMLMKAFMDDVLYNDIGNQLTFIKRCTFDS
ncbi:MAG: ATP-binding protein [Planctomycetaceae bacterium]|tara:strand:+ start:112 stop:531 length:420 start_codon:yes stop_codon:yes gene_type:complete